MSDRDEEKRRWGIDQRLEFIESRLFWDGGLNRADIIDRFGVSTAQASADLALYKELAPDNLKYDGSQKRFVASDQFIPKIIQPNADRYLVQLKAIADSVIQIADTSIGNFPAIDSMPIPRRRIDPTILRKLLCAIRGERGLNIYYHSMSADRPLPLWRDITPHAFVFDGLRWHVRAYCHLESRFKDFILSRILKLGSEINPSEHAKKDHDWSEFFNVIMIPNPKLSTSQQKTVARDYDMKGGKLNIPVRRALLYYFNKRLRLDVADQVDNPKETPIVVANKIEFIHALKLAGA